VKTAILRQRKAVLVLAALALSAFAVMAVDLYLHQFFWAVINTLGFVGWVAELTKELGKR
jgi:hypothetical protein